MLTPNHVSYWRLTPNHVKLWHSSSFFLPNTGERKKLASFSVIYVQYFIRIRIRFFMSAGSGSVEYRPGSATLQETIAWQSEIIIQFKASAVVVDWIHQLKLLSSCTVSNDFNHEVGTGATPRIASTSWVKKSCLICHLCNCLFLFFMMEPERLAKLISTSRHVCNIRSE